MKRLLLAVLVTATLGCGKYEKKTFCGKLKAKQEKKDPIGIYGGFETNYYWMLDNGMMEEVDLEHYMKYEVGDSVCIDKLIKVQTKK